MTTSLSILAITTKILALREARVLWVCLLTSLSNSLHMKYSKGFQSSELGGQISLEQWSFRLTFRQAWVILVVWGGLCPAGTCRDILRQQSPSRVSRTSMYCLVLINSVPSQRSGGAWRRPCLRWPHRTMTEAENFVLLSGRSDICLPNILVLVQNCL
jgi:hypothetical protein